MVKINHYKHNRLHLLDFLPRNSVGAEIGVWKGDFSNHLLQTVEPKKLYLIDPWEFSEKDETLWYGGKHAKSQGDMDTIHENVVKKFSHAANVSVIRDTSARALLNFEEASLDWIYIDGNHEYDFVLEDLIQSKRVVKQGGLITGDDMFFSKNREYPVKKAVDRFMADNPALHLQNFGSQFIIMQKSK